MAIPRHYLEWQEVEDLVFSIKVQIQQNQNLPPISNIAGLPRGGLIPAVILSHMTGIPYSDEVTSQTLIVDDIADSGQTLSKYSTNMTAVLYYKPNASIIKPTIYGTISNNNDWIVFPWEGVSSMPIQDYLT